MPAQYQSVATTTAVQGGNKVVKIRVYSWLSQPSGTYFETRARYNTNRADAKVQADVFSETIEAILAAPDYTAVSYAQDVDPAGNLLPVYTVYYYIPEQQASGFVEVKSSDFNVNYVAEAVLEDLGPGTFLFAP